MRPSAELSDTLAAAARLFFGEEDCLAADLERGNIPLPSLSLLRMSRLRLDLASIAFERLLFFLSGMVFHPISVGGCKPPAWAELSLWAGGQASHPIPQRVR